ncbi:MAG: pentapeptide repeat-containing protein [Planctomycetaceae bacterium]|nr:pentapeptide repeat-containing protein [Planctomycetaceae bacterium]
MPRLFLSVTVFFLLASGVSAQVVSPDGTWILGRSDFHGEKLNGLLAYEEPDVFEGFNFSDSIIDSGHLSLGKFLGCKFIRTVFKDAYLTGETQDCDFTDCFFQGGEVWLSREEWLQTRNFREKTFHSLIVRGKLEDLDLSGAVIQGGDFSNASLAGCCLENTCFQDCSLPDLTQEQFTELKNFRIGDLTGLIVPGETLMEHDDYFGFAFGGKRDSRGKLAKLNFWPDQSFENAVFVQADLSEVWMEAEQVMKTWNWRNQRMDLAKWPKNIEEELNVSHWGDPIQEKNVVKDPRMELRERLETLTVFTGDVHIRAAKELEEDGTNCYFEDADLSGLELKHFDRTVNVQKGLFVRCRLENWTRRFRAPKDLSRSVFLGCRVAADLAGIDLTNTAFINCDLSEAFMTFSQFETTWNYQTGRLSMTKWPEHIEKKLKEEEKAKEEEKE